MSGRQLFCRTVGEKILVNIRLARREHLWHLYRRVPRVCREYQSCRGPTAQTTVRRDFPTDGHMCSFVKVCERMDLEFEMIKQPLYPSRTGHGGRDVIWGCPSYTVAIRSLIQFMNLQIWSFYSCFNFWFQTTNKYLQFCRFSFKCFFDEIVA